MHAGRVFLRSDDARDGVADFFEARKVPQVREVTTLLRLHGLDRTIATREKNTLTVRLVLQRQPAAISGQTRELLDEIELGELVKAGEARDLGLGEAHLPGPTTARGAALAFVENRHAQKLGEDPERAKRVQPRGQNTSTARPVFARTARAMSDKLRNDRCPQPGRAAGRRAE